MDRPRILVLSPPMEEPGGIQMYTATLVRALRNICGDDNIRLLSLPAPSTSDERDRTSLSFAAKSSFFRRAVKLARNSRPRVTLCTHVGLAPVGHFISKIVGGDCWVSAHGIEVWGRLSLIKRHALRAADKILAVSDFTRDRVIHLHRIPSERVVLLPNALDADLLHVPPDDRKLAGLGLDSKRRILTVGRLAAAERYKGHDAVLRALPIVLAQCPSAVYLIAGDGDDRARLQQLSRDLGVADAVYFLGSLKRAELAAAYNVCEIFAMPARTLLNDGAPKGEGFGIAFLEAMAFARPVIGPNSGAPAEFITHEQTGLLVDPDNVGEIAAAILRLLSDARLARELGERARALVDREYSFDALVRRLEPFLASLD